jgi:hypothetical protein
VLWRCGEGHALLCRQGKHQLAARQTLARPDYKKKKIVLAQVTTLKELETKRVPVNSHKNRLPQITLLSEGANQAGVSERQPPSDMILT